MARLKDVPVVLKRVGAFRFLCRVWGQVDEDDLLTWGAAMAYAWLFAIFPFFIFLLSLLPYLPEGLKATAATEIKNALYANLPAQGAETLWANVGNVLTQPRQSLLGLGIFITLWAASGGMAMTIKALDTVYELQESRKFYKVRTLAVVLTIAVATLIISVMILLPIGTMVTRWLDQANILPKSLLHALDVARWSLATLFMFGVVALVYHFAPDVKQKFRLITPGSVLVIALWVLLGLGFRLYVEKVGSASYSRTYGTVGGVAILLLLFYLDAVVLLIGAEINSEIDFEILGVPRGTRDFRVPIIEKITALATPADQPAPLTPPGAPLPER